MKKLKNEKNDFSRKIKNDFKNEKNDFCRKMIFVEK